MVYTVYVYVYVYVYPFISQVMYTVVTQYVDGYTVETMNVIEAQENSHFYLSIHNSPSYNSKAMAHHHTWDKPDLQNIIPDDQKQKQNASNRARGLDPYFTAVKATTKPRQAQV